MTIGRGRIWVVGVSVVAVEELDDVESEPVHVEVDVAHLEIRRACFPNSDFGMKAFDRAPGGLPDAEAVKSGRDEKEVKVAAPFFLVDPDDNTSGDFSARDDAVGLGVAGTNGAQDGPARNDLAVLLEVRVPRPKLLRRTVEERLLVVTDELLLVRRLQRDELHGTDASGLHVTVSPQARRSWRGWRRSSAHLCLR